MSDATHPAIVDDWQKSSFSNPSGNCAELAPTDDGGAAMRNSREPDGPNLFFNRGEIDAFVRGAKAGEFDRYLI